MITETTIIDGQIPPSENSDTLPTDKQETPFSYKLLIHEQGENNGENPLTILYHENNSDVTFLKNSRMMVL